MSKKLCFPIYKKEELVRDYKTSYLVGIKELSRRSKLDLDGLINITANHCTQDFIFDFDILICERDWEEKKSQFQKIPLENFSRIRCQDPGVVNYIFQNTDKDIELILETGHHNWKSIEVWCDYLGNRLKKVILSYELSSEKIKEYSHKLKARGIESELLIFGDILLFYGPRKLLEKDFGKDDISIMADSEESPHKNFPVVQNQHGTFMYHLKKLSLLDRLDQLKKMDIDYRLELENLGSETTGAVLECVTKHKNINVDIPVKTTRGYFDRNKTDVLFPKLRNSHLKRNPERHVGEVLGVSKGEFLAVKLQTRGISLGQKLHFKNSQGHQVSANVSKLLTPEKEVITSAKAGELVLINYLNKITPKSVVSLDQ